MLSKALNIAKNSLKRKNLSVMMGKVFIRFKETETQKNTTEMTSWCIAHAEECGALLEKLDSDLWNETQQVCGFLKKRGEDKLKTIDKDLGGGGNYHLLYFMVRYIQAKIVVETGVAAGWSSQSILTALQKNENDGKLYSSDFPYFRFDNPEKYIGFLVDEDLKKQWSLFIDGDQNNLPLIAGQVERIDLFHYDSDKSYQGRDFAYDRLKPKLYDQSVIIFDDIQDNLHFKEFVESQNSSFCVLEFEGKYVGVIAPCLKDL